MTFKITKISPLHIILLAVITVTVCLFAASPSMAATYNGSNTMRISPVRTDIQVAPGASKSVPITVTNLTDSTMNLEPIENDFIAGSKENGQPALILDKNQYAPTHSLKRFMMPLKNFSLGPHKAKQMELQINVPPSAQAGGYFGALRFIPAGSDNQNAANSNVATQVIKSSVASLVLMTVPGPTTHKLVLTNFDIQQNGKTGGNFNKPNNLSVLLRFDNQGNVQEAPFGQITLQKGSKVVYTDNFNQTDPKSEVLPDSARRWSVPLKNVGSFGKYTVTGTFTYANGKSVQTSTSFWIIPKILIAGVIGGIILIVLIIWGIRRFLKAYKRRILRAHR